LSRITGLPNKYISSIEHEKKKATLANIEAIAKGLECLMCDLFMPIKEKNMDEEQRQKVRAEIITRFRSNLKRIREAAGIAQEDLDRRCGLPPGETKNLEEGVKGCTLGAIQDIADELGCRFHELLQRLQM
jgi:transcriptional regulator with XRE-family HTH domain